MSPLTKNIEVYIEAHFCTRIAVFLWIIVPSIPFKTATQPAFKTACLNLTLWGLKKIEKIYKIILEII